MSQPNIILILTDHFRRDYIDRQPARNCIITGMHHLQPAGYHTALIGKHHYIDRYGIGLDVTQDDEYTKHLAPHRLPRLPDHAPGQCQ